VGYTLRRRSNAVTGSAILRWTPLAAILILLAACSSPKPEGNASKQPAGAAKRPAGSAPPAVFPPDNQPSTWSGTFPGTANWSERWTLHIRPDATYFLREEHVGHGEAGSDHIVDDIGRWEKATDGGPLRLTGGRVRSMEIEVRHPDTLRLPVLDPAAGSAPRDLVRSVPTVGFEPSLSLTGHFRYMADAARFDDCLAGLRLAVLMEGDYLAAEKAYSVAASAPGAPLLVEIEGRIVQRPGPDGSSPRDHLFIERFVRALPGDDCPPHGD